MSYIICGHANPSWPSWWERGRNQLVRHRGSQLERAAFVGFFLVQFVCGSLLHPNHGHRWSGKQLLCTPPLCCSLGGSFLQHHVLKAAVFEDVVEGTALSWGQSGHQLPDTCYLLSREGIIRVVRQNTWDLDLFWSSVVRAHTFPLFQGCAGQKQCVPVKGFFFHSATDTAPSWCCCFQSDWPPFPINERVSSQKPISFLSSWSFPPLFLIKVGRGG